MVVLNVLCGCSLALTGRSDEGLVAAVEMLMSDGCRRSSRLQMLVFLRLKQDGSLVSTDTSKLCCRALTRVVHAVLSADQ